MLLGKKLAVYRPGEIDRAYEFTPDQRVDMRPSHETRQAFAFHDGLLCVAKTCSTLVSWPNGNVLEFNSGSGKLHAWWVVLNQAPQRHSTRALVGEE